MHQVTLVTSRVEFVPILDFFDSLHLGKPVVTMFSTSDLDTSKLLSVVSIPQLASFKAWWLVKRDL
jgi:hypothetical protein